MMFYDLYSITCLLLSTNCMVHVEKSLTLYHVIIHRSRLQETKLISEQLKPSKPWILSIKRQQNSPLTLQHDHIIDANESSN